VQEDHNTDAEYRVAFDFEALFSNGGGLKGWDFRLDIKGNEISDNELADHIVADLRLLMVGSVAILNKRVFPEQHKRKPEVEPENQVRAAQEPKLYDCPMLSDTERRHIRVFRRPR
jgi:hypothetical protein